VQVAADHALHLPVALQHRRQAIGPCTQADGIHVADAGDEGRVVHRHHGRHARRRCQRAVQPPQAVRAQGAVAGPRHHGVQRHQAQAGGLTHPQHETGQRRVVDGRQFVVVGEGRAQRRHVVVVARQQPHRAGQRGQQRAQVRVLGRLAAVNQIASHHHRRGAGLQGQHTRHGLCQQRRGVDAVQQQAAGRHDMGVGQLHEHGPGLRGGLALKPEIYGFP
jgi:hypothetical protein